MVLEIIDRDENKNCYCVVCVDHFDDFFLFGTEKVYLAIHPFRRPPPLSNNNLYLIYSLLVRFINQRYLIYILSFIISCIIFLYYLFESFPIAGEI